MENEKNSDEPEFITKEENGKLFLEVKMSDKLRKKMEEEVKHVSGAIILSI